MNDHKWLTTKEAADYVRSTPRQLLVLVRNNVVKGYPLSGCQRKTWRFLASDLDAHLLGVAENSTQAVVSSSTSSAVH